MNQKRVDVPRNSAQIFNSRIANFKDLIELSGYPKLKHFHNGKRHNDASGILSNNDDKISMTSHQKLKSPQKKVYSLKKKGIMVKRGDGPFDYSWNERFFVLDGKTLMYFDAKETGKPRAVLFLAGSTIEPMDDNYINREVKWGFVINLKKTKKDKEQQKIYLSGLTELENLEWHDMISEACYMSNIDQSQTDIENGENNN